MEQKSIAQTTREKLDARPHMNRKKKNKIRTEGVKEYICSKYRGAPIAQAELMRAAGFNPMGNTGTEYWNGYAFLRKLMNEGIIVKEDEQGKKSSSYRVPSRDTEVSKPTEQAEVRVVTRDEADNIPDKPYEVATSAAEDATTDQTYSFELTVAKRNTSGEFGKIRMGQIEMTDVTVETARKMINELLDNLS